MAVGCAGRSHQYVPVRSSGADGQTASTAGASPRTPAMGASATGAHEMQPGIYFVTVDGKRRTTRVESVFHWHQLAADACGGRDRYEILAYPVGWASSGASEVADPNLLEGYVRCRVGGTSSRPPQALPADPEPAAVVPEDPPEPAEPVEPEPAEAEPTEAPEPAAAPTPAPAPTPALPPPG